MNRKKILVLCLDAAVALLALVAGVAAETMLRILPDCFVMRLGFLCPACGGTRCVRALFSGRIGEAFCLNPYIFITAFYLGALLVLVNVAFLFGCRPIQKVPGKMVSPMVVIAWAVGFVAFGIIRNIL